MNQILTIIVLYHCKLENSRTYRTLRPSSTDLLIFDNSENKQDISHIAKNAVYVFNGGNLGLSKCYNMAAKYAEENGYDWLLFLDQDTDFSEISISDYQKAILEGTCDMIAPLVKAGEFIMSPMNFKHNFARLSKKTFQGIEDVNNISIINSGMCVSLNAFYNVGGYNENVFLDYSDHEFVRRFKKKYSSVYILPQKAYQDFSVKSDNRESALARYKLLCQSIRGCERENLKDNFWFAFVVTKRALSLCMSLRSLIPLKILHNYYFIHR